MLVDSHCHLDFETFAPELDAVVQRARDARAVALRGWPVGEVARRERTQMSLSTKRARAHHVIENKGSIDDLDREVSPRMLWQQRQDAKADKDAPGDA